MGSKTKVVSLAARKRPFKAMQDESGIEEDGSCTSRQIWPNLFVLIEVLRIQATIYEGIGVRHT